MTVSFALTWDYRCPFARNAHEHVLTGLAAGADWDVTFLAFSLGQAHVEEGQPSVWDKPEQDGGILALQAGVIVRDHFAPEFLSVHRAFFAARHDRGLQLDDRSVIEEVLREQGLPVEEVFERVDSGEGLGTVHDEHERYAASHSVWGVPTFIAGDQAVFVRLMDRSPLGADPSLSVRTVERTVDLVSGWTELNEFKHTSNLSLGAFLGSQCPATPAFKALHTTRPAMETGLCLSEADVGATPIRQCFAFWDVTPLDPIGNKQLLRRTCTGWLALHPFASQRAGIVGLAGSSRRSDECQVDHVALSMTAAHSPNRRAHA